MKIGYSDNKPKTRSVYVCSVCMLDIRATALHYIVCQRRHCCCNVTYFIIIASRPSLLLTHNLYRIKPLYEISAVTRLNLKLRSIRAGHIFLDFSRKSKTSNRCKIEPTICQTYWFF